MKTKKKRKPNFNRIAPTRTYTIASAAKALGKSESTVRTWIRRGMPTLNDGHHPVMISGAAMLDWLKEFWQSRKHKCADDELFCLKCQKARKPEPSTIEFSRTNTARVRLKAKCSVCGSIICKCIAKRRMAEVEAAFMRLSLNGENIGVYAGYSTNAHNLKELAN